MRRPSTGPRAGPFEAWLIHNAIEAGCGVGTSFDLLAEEVQERVPAQLRADFDSVLARLEQLPDRLRAMAATDQLEVNVLPRGLGRQFASCPSGVGSGEWYGGA